MTTLKIPLRNMLDLPKENMPVIVVRKNGVKFLGKLRAINEFNRGSDVNNYYWSFVGFDLTDYTSCDSTDMWCYLSEGYKSED